MKTAKLIDPLEKWNKKCAAGGKIGHGALYECNPPLQGHKYVVVSATDVPFSGPETYIFPANKKGAVKDWCELEGSYRGGMSHAEALRNAGYEITEKQKP